VEESNIFDSATWKGCKGGNMDKDAILNGLENAIVNGKKAEAINFAKDALSRGSNP